MNNVQNSRIDSCFHRQIYIRLGILYTKSNCQYYELMGESSRLTPLSIVCKQPGPMNRIPLLLS